MRTNLSFGLRARAALLGRSGLASVKAVARQFGFASSDAFTRFYTRRYGERPSQTLARL